MKGVNALVNLNSRPFRNTGFTVRYRYNDRDNQTPPFDATEYVRFDAVPEEIEDGLSQQYDTTRKTLDANASYSLTGWGALRVGYGHDAWERHGRGFSNVGDDSSACRSIRSRAASSRFARATSNPGGEARGSSSPAWTTKVWAARSQAFDTSMKRIAIGAGPR